MENRFVKVNPEWEKTLGYSTDVELTLAAFKTHRTDNRETERNNQNR